jgi:hypothetical protein
MTQISVGLLLKEFGIPMHNGLLYALGIAITMEGVLSASYHICPSPSNYQFGTPIASLLVHFDNMYRCA